MRRQSSGSSKIPQQQQKQDTTENLFEIDDMKLSPPPPPPDSETSDVHHMHIDAAASPSTTGLKPAKDNNNKDRTSISGRPLRKAAEKVHSYKEIPLNSKMRRKDH